jgi:cytidylate kinase
VLLHAPLEFRIARVMKVYRVKTEEAAQRMIEERDKARIAFRAKMTKEDPWDASNYHLSVDTSGLALGQVADLIVACQKARAAAKAR